jgi:hypothetical protein
MPRARTACTRLTRRRRSRPASAAAIAGGQHSQVEKILEIRQELPGRINIVLIRQPVGF